MNTTESAQNLNKYTSAELFRGTKEVVIEHLSQEYRLRITSNGKLILTK